MIDETELIKRMRCLEADVLHEWIDAGLIEPRREAEGCVFDAIDEARVALVCDLHYRMGLGHDSLPVILSLIDQLHHTRHSLRAIASAVAEQPDEVKMAITTRTRIVLARRQDRSG